jgi:hypothetical protein
MLPNRGLFNLPSLVLWWNSQKSAIYITGTSGAPREEVTSK